VNVATGDTGVAEGINVGVTIGVSGDVRDVVTARVGEDVGLLVSTTEDPPTSA